MINPKPIKKVALVILDGVGIDAESPTNAATAETLPSLYQAMRQYGYASLHASGTSVGLEEGQVGNSVIGHLILGLGRIEPSNLIKINKAFEDGSWAKHSAWDSIAKAKCLHIVGLLSDAGTHAHWSTILQAATIAKQKNIPNIQLHLLLDGIDSQTGSATALLSVLMEQIHALDPKIQIGLIMGRRWFADRSGNFTQTQVFIKALSQEKTLPSFSLEILTAYLAYNNEAGFPPHFMPKGTPIQPGDPILITSHRADRAFQAVKLLTEKYQIFTMTTFDNLVHKSQVFFPTQAIFDGMTFILQKHDIYPVRIAETCKFPHVSYFFNGFNKTLGETQIHIPSLKADPAEHPEMQAKKIAEATIKVLQDPTNQALIVNLANCDQVGHSGNIDLVIKAAYYTDQALQNILSSAYEYHWSVILTSDHGNAETMADAQGKPSGAHTKNPVPFTVVPAPGLEITWLSHNGSLTQVASSFLTLMEITPNANMDQPLISLVKK